MSVENVTRRNASSEIILSKYLLILGNGFDLDLGMKTRYSDFFNSPFWPAFDGYSTLRNMLVKAAEENPEWFDIESLLRLFALSQDDMGCFSKDKAFFDELLKSFSAYIRAIDKPDNCNSSLAARIINAVKLNSRYKIYSFNFTDYEGGKVSHTSSRERMIEHIHGRAANDSIIIGIDDDVKLAEERNSFLYKTFSPHYSSKRLAFDLDSAKEVIIFGHSFGDIDYPYFKKFFRDVCNESNTERRMRKITIITYDEESRIRILMQLRNMNENKMSYLFHKNDLQFICTEPSVRSQYESKIEALLKHINYTRPHYY